MNHKPVQKYKIMINRPKGRIMVRDMEQVRQVYIIDEELFDTEIQVTFMWLRWLMWLLGFVVDSRQGE
jgi:hypothetical protein